MAPTDLSPDLAADTPSRTVANDLFRKQAAESHKAAMSDQPEGLRIARYVNIGVWFWLLASDVLSPVRTGRDFWDAKLAQAFSVNRYLFEPVYMIGVTAVILALWFAVDLLLRWLWSQGRDHQQRED